MSENPQRVVCAALRLGSGSIVCGPRHFDKTMHGQIAATSLNWAQAEQGFVDQYGAFLTRKEAWDVAKRQDQIRRDSTKSVGTLYSEHLY